MRQAAWTSEMSGRPVFVNSNAKNVGGVIGIAQGRATKTSRHQAARRTSLCGLVFWCLCGEGALTDGNTLLLHYQNAKTLGKKNHY